MEFVVIAQYQVRPGQADRVGEALRNMVAPSRGSLRWTTGSGSTWSRSTLPNHPVREWRSLIVRPST
jgi:hypothetical protein